MTQVPEMTSTQGQGNISHIKICLGLNVLFLLVSWIWMLNIIIVHILSVWHDFDKSCCLFPQSVMNVNKDHNMKVTLQT